MAYTPEQFDLFLKEKSAELTEAWKAFHPTEGEVHAKAIIDYQYNATVAILKAIQEMATIQLDRHGEILKRMNEIESKIKGEV